MKPIHPLLNGLFNFIALRFAGAVCTFEHWTVAGPFGRKIALPLSFILIVCVFIGIAGQLMPVWAILIAIAIGIFCAKKLDKILESYEPRKRLVRGQMQESYLYSALTVLMLFDLAAWIQFARWILWAVISLFQP